VTREGVFDRCQTSVTCTCTSNFAPNMSKRLLPSEEEPVILPEDVLQVFCQQWPVFLGRCAQLSRVWRRFCYQFILDAPSEWIERLTAVFREIFATRTNRAADVPRFYRLVQHGDYVIAAFYDRAHTEGVVSFSIHGAKCSFNHNRGANWTTRYIRLSTVGAKQEEWMCDQNEAYLSKTAVNSVIVAPLVARALYHREFVAEKDAFLALGL
jgi:hypothetical protein